MSFARTLFRALPWSLVAAGSVLIDRLLRQHEHVLHTHDRLFSRLAQVEQRLDGPANEPPAEAGGVLYRTVRLNDRLSFEIAIDARLPDPISQAIAAGDGWFLDDYRVLLDCVRSGDRVLDLGAHVGTFGLAAAALGCHVVCVEAAPPNIALLNKSVARNGFDHLRVVHAAVADRAGVLPFIPNGPWGTIANMSVARAPALIYDGMATPVKETLTEVEVPSLTVDGLLRELGWERVDVVKIDIEGSETAALRGMRRLLSRPDAPTILYEGNAHMLRFVGETPQRLAATLHEFGYTTYMVEPDRLVLFRPNDTQPRCVANYVAVKEQPPVLAGRPVVAGLRFEEIVDTIISQSLSQWAHDRAYVARMLAGAVPSLRTDPRVMFALKRLCRDPDADVRAAAAWCCGQKPVPQHNGRVSLHAEAKEPR